MAKFKPKYLKPKRKRSAAKNSKGKEKVKLENQNSECEIKLTIVPWISKSEWHTIKQMIFSPKLEDIIAALNRLSAWKSRCHLNVPLGIEVTDALLRAYVRDCNLQNSREAQIHHGDLVMMYSSAIIRFVNLVTEMGQKCFTKTPLHILAKRMKIPEWLVDLRHDATHTNYPALSTLQSGFHVAMDWIEKYYWNEEEACMTDLSLNEPLHELIKKDKSQFNSNTNGIFTSWELATEKIDWEKYPLGILPNQLEEYPFLDLSLPLTVDKLYSHQPIALKGNTVDSNDTESFVDLMYDGKCMPNLEDQLHITEFTKARHFWTEEQVNAFTIPTNRCNFGGKFVFSYCGQNGFAVAAFLL